MTKEVSKLYKHDTYRVEGIDFVLSSYIREYDINKANISILRRLGYITDAEYNVFYNMPGQERKIRVGLFLRDNKEANDALMDGFELLRKEFFEANMIEDTDVFAINRDAIFLLNKEAQYTEFDGVTFGQDKIYTSFYRIYFNNRTTVEFYFRPDPINDSYIIEVKGLNKEALALHKNYMVDFLGYLFSLAETSTDISVPIRVLNNFYDAYVNRVLDMGYYREFNSISKYTVMNSGSIMQYSLEYANNDQLPYIDISYNADIFGCINSYYHTIWEKHIR